MSLHKFVGPNGFKRISHMQAMMEERVALTERYGEVATSTGRPEPIGSSFSIDRTADNAAVEALRREVALFIGEATTETSRSVVIVPFDGTEDAGSIHATRATHPPTSIERASLPT